MWYQLIKPTRTSSKNVFKTTFLVLPLFVYLNVLTGLSLRPLSLHKSGQRFARFWLNLGGLTQANCPTPSARDAEMDNRRPLVPSPGETELSGLITSL